MRDYGIVSPRFWMGETGKAIRQRGVEAQLVGLYLLTSPHANMLGLYYCPAVFISHETGIPLEGALKGLRSLQEVRFCQYDTTSEYVYIPEMARFQIAESLKASDNRVVGINKEYAALANNPFLKDFYLKYKDAFHLTEARGLEAPPKPLRSQEQEQEQEQDQDTTPPSAHESELPPLPDIAETATDWVKFFQRLGYELFQIKTAENMTRFGNWCKRQVPFATADIGIEAAIAKLGHKPDTPKYYLGFIEEAITAASRLNTQSQRQETNHGQHGRRRYSENEAVRIARERRAGASITIDAFPTDLDG